MIIKYAAILGLSLVAIIIGIDIYLFRDNIVGNTWSEMVREFGNKNPLLPWVLGGLLGHFYHVDFLPKHILGDPQSAIVLVWLSVVVGVAGLVLKHGGITVPPVIVLFAGFVVWNFFV